MTTFAHLTPADQSRLHPSWCGAHLCRDHDGIDLFHYEEPVRLTLESGGSVSLGLCRADEIVDGRQVVYPSEFQLEVNGSETWLSGAEFVRLMLMGLSRAFSEGVLEPDDVAVIRALIDAAEGDR